MRLTARKKPNGGMRPRTKNECDQYARTFAESENSEPGVSQWRGRLSFAGRAECNCLVAAGERRLLAAVAGVCRPSFPRQRRLHGPRQLGERPPSRSTVSLRTVVGGGPVQPNGDRYAGDRRPPGRGYGKGLR